MYRFPTTVLRTTPKCYLGFCRYAKDVKLRADVRTTMVQGIDALANAVSFTLGPKARKAIIDQAIGSPKIRDKGVTVEQAVELRNKLQDIGVKAVHELAYRKDENTVDGATTAVVLARAIARSGFEKIATGASPTDIRRGIMLAVNEVKRHLKAISRPIASKEEIEQVAAIYANGDKALSDLVCEAISKVCRDGIISVRKGKGQSDELEIIEGMKLDSGFVSPYFINTPHGEMVDFQNALLLLTANRVSSIKTIMPVVELACSKRTPLVIIADDIAGEALKSLLLRRLKSGMRVAGVKAPGYGDNKKAILNDIAIATGGAVFGSHTKMARLEEVKLKDLGKIGNVIIRKNETMLLNGMGKRENIARRIDLIKDQITMATTPLKRKNLRERLASLASGIVLIHVGGNSELEINKKIERINATLRATRAAIDEGIVPGGGIALLKCISCLDAVDGCNDNQRMGIEIVRNALRLPCLTIATNAGIDAAMVVSCVEGQKDNGYGFNALKGEFGNFVEMGIIDPTKSIRTAITEAAGVASLLMTAETAIADISKGKA